jgi:hypothetical protein
MGARFDELTAHLTPSHCDYFMKWHRMIAMEEEAGAPASSKALNNQASYMSSIEREKHGTCSARMRVATVHAVPAAPGGGCGRDKEQVVVLERFDTDAGFERLFASTRRPLTDLALLEGLSLCLSLSLSLSLPLSVCTTRLYRTRSPSALLLLF